MSFIGESREDNMSPWQNYLCLDKTDARLIMSGVKSGIIRKSQIFMKYVGKHEAGEATERDQTRMVNLEEELNALEQLLCRIEKYINAPL